MTLAPTDDLTDTPVAHLTPPRWDVANRLLVRKMLSELAHERLLTPRRADDGRYVVRSDDGAVAYRFTASVMALDHWDVDAASITRERDGTLLELDALALVLEVRGSLGLDDGVLPVYLEEITSTLASSAYKLAHERLGAHELARAGFQQIESGMTEGHPCFVANNGRLGFDGDDYLAYAPETGSTLRLVWLAVRRDRSTFSACADVDYDGLVRSELGEATRDRFDRVLRGRGLDPDGYHLMPVHPWQWRNRICVTFAGDLAREHVVHLGEGDDDHQPQQSIRTLFNVSDPSRHYVKTALSVLNMGFVRGLSAEYMKGTPAINDWVAHLVAGDAVLARYGFRILRECAAIGYHSEHYEAASPKGSPYRKMLAALWRESPVPSLAPGERLATMASLLHVDSTGTSLVSGLVAESGLSARDWLRRYLDAYLVPVLHCLYAHDLAFIPHGENVILVLRGGVVQRVLMKDVAEEVAVMSADVPLPEAVERVRVAVPDDIRMLSVFTDVLDCFLRFLAPILQRDGLLTEDEFWATVAASAADYQRSAPELADRFARDDLFVEEFALSCLNRLQLRDNRQMVDLTDPAGALQLVGSLTNPLARWRPAESSGARP